MERCRTLELPSICFHRFNYLQDSIGSIHSRLTRIIEAGGLSKLVNRDDILQQLANHAETMALRPIVALLGDFDALGPYDVVEYASPLNNKSNYVEKHTCTADVFQNVWSEYSPVTFVMYLKLDHENWKQKLTNAKAFLDRLTEAQRQSCILFLNRVTVVDKVTLRDLQSSCQSYNIIMQDLEPGQTQHLYDVIQIAMETKVMRILEGIVDFIKQFMSSNSYFAEDPANTIFAEVSNEIGRIINSPTITKDIAFAKRASRRSSPVPMETDRQAAKGATEETTQIEPEVYRQCLCEFIYACVHSIVIRQLTRRLQLSSLFVRHCLDGFDFHQRYMQEAKVQYLPGIPAAPSPEEQSMDVPDDQVSKVNKSRKRRCKAGLRRKRPGGMFHQAQFVSSLWQVMQDAEDFVRQKANSVASLHKIRFEISGMLRNAKVPISKMIDTIPELPPGLQDDILSLDYVNGCGRFYGNLLIHVNTERTALMTKTIHKLIKKRNYPYQFSIERTYDDVRFQARVQYDAGSQIRGKPRPSSSIDPSAEIQSSDAVSHRYGTLGGFLYKNTTLSAMTCAHVLSGCDEEIRLKAHSTKYIPFGTFDESFSISSGFGVDFAVFEVVQEERENCNLHLKNRSGFSFPSVIYTDDTDLLQAKKVFKWGDRSNYTEGIIISNDFKKKYIKDANFEMPNAFHEDYNVVVEPFTDAGNTEPFSRDGDSGAIVCELEIKLGWLTAISMVTAGAYGKVNNQDAYYSLTSLIHKCIACLAEKTGHTFEWPTFSDD